MIERRRFLIGASLVLAAPAIVRVGSLMPVRALRPDLFQRAAVMWHTFTFEPMVPSDRWFEAEIILAGDFERRLVLTPLRNPP